MTQRAIHACRVSVQDRYKPPRGKQPVGDSHKREASYWEPSSFIKALASGLMKNGIVLMKGSNTKIKEKKKKDAEEDVKEAGTPLFC